MNTLLDVRTIEPHSKHPFIFKNFDGLLYGEILTLINDHDPLPLFYQFQSERAGTFNWEYLAKGPEIWQVKITKTHIPSKETVADIVRNYPKAIATLKKLNMDYCCNGKRLFEDACAEIGLSPNEVKKQIVNSTEEVPIHLHANKWSLDFLADYIVENHHTYVKSNIAEIEQLIEKVAKVHGKEHPELYSIQKHFISLSIELLQHTSKEEKILFPMIKELVNFKKRGVKSTVPFGTIQNPITVMEDEHAGAGEELESIRRLTNNFILPANACYSFQSLYKLLEEFEEDLHQHIHLENNILFPKAIELEKELK